MSAAKRGVKRARPKSKTSTESEEIQQLEGRIAEGAPPSGSTQPNPDVPKEVNYANREKLSDLPLSRYTKDALREGKFETLMAIQKAAIPHALAGRDVLGTAKTGSGKTLAFVIPVLEKLYRLRWSRFDGLGALIISPTRELALQIFGELRKVGKYHDLSAGLLIGGKDIKEEQGRVDRLNILVATPGRLLKHMDETAGFDAAGLQILVLDEADRCLDKGFAPTLNLILENLPPQKQVLLFSATTTKKVKDLKTRLGLDAPEYVHVHAEAAAPTPVKLQQSFMRCQLSEKLDLLWSFLRTHVKAKTIVFFATCKQVHFAFEAFRRLRPGVPLKELHGKMKQYKRVGIYQEFTEAKGGMALFATDVAARGLDFAGVDWVVQVDCPEDVKAYIHRVGRTARLHANGHSVMMLLPSEEESMLQLLKDANVPLRAMKVNPQRTQSVTPALQSLLSKNKDLKELAQKALCHYVRAVSLCPNKHVFNASALQLGHFALSLGLSSVPEVRYVKRVMKQAEHAAGLPNSQPASPPAVEGAGSAARRGSGMSLKHAPTDAKLRDADGDATAPVTDNDSDDDFLVMKRRHEAEHEEEADADPADPDLPARKKRRKQKIQPGKGTGKRIVFGDDGEPTDALALMVEDADNWGVTADHASKEERFQAEREAMKDATKEDRARQKAERIRRKVEARERARAAREGRPAIVELGQQGYDPEPDPDRESERSPSPPAAPRNVVDTAYLGMQAPEATPQERRAAAVADGLSLEEREALVLRLLAQR